MIRKHIDCTILGSFKFKKEIDLVRQEFEDHGVTVLAPQRGSVYVPSVNFHIQNTSGFRPLPGERGYPLKAVEDGFLKAITRSNLVYLVDINGYIGSVVNFEIGFVTARGIPLYASNSVNLQLDSNPNWQNMVNRIPIMSVPDAIKDFTIRYSFSPS